MTNIFGQQLGNVNSKLQQSSKRMLPLLIIIILFHPIISLRSFVQHENQSNKLYEDFTSNFHLMHLLKRSAEKNWTEIDPNCGIYRDQSLHAVMDRVCELCHEMFSYEENSLRAECRKNCFRNIKFRTCLQLFAPSTNGVEN